MSQSEHAEHKGTGSMVPHGCVTIARRDALALIRLISRYQEFLESAIDNMCAPGAEHAFDPDDASLLACDRNEWSRAEYLVRRLEAVVTIKGGH